MDAAVHRRLTVAVCWAMARRAALDEEFREWLLCLEDNPELLRETVLMVPSSFPMQGRPETDGLLEI
jgi:hypothetical protein